MVQRNICALFSVIKKKSFFFEPVRYYYNDHIVLEILFYGFTVNYVKGPTILLLTPVDKRSLLLT